MADNSEVKELILKAETIQVLLDNVAQVKILCEKVAEGSAAFNRRFPQFKNMANEIRQHKKMFEDFKASLPMAKEIADKRLGEMTVRQRRHILAQVEDLETTLNTILN